MRHFTPKRRAMAAIEKEALAVFNEKIPHAVVGRATPKLDKKLKELEKRRKEAEEMLDVATCFGCGEGVNILPSTTYGVAEVRQLAIRDESGEERHIYFSRADRFHIPLCLECAKRMESEADDQLIELASEDAEG